MAPWPIERRQSPGIEEKVGLLAHQVERLCAELQEIDAKIDGVSRLAQQALRQTEDNGRAMAAAKVALEKHEKRAEQPLAAFEAASTLRQVFVLVIGTMVATWAAFAAWLQAAAWWRGQ